MHCRVMASHDSNRRFFVTSGEILALTDVHSHCTNVSKTWRAVLTSMPSLWTTIDLGSTKRTRGHPSMARILEYISYSSNKTQILRLKDIALQGTKNLQMLTRACPRLRELTLWGRIELSTSLVEGCSLCGTLERLHLLEGIRTTTTTIRSIFNSCRNLKEVDFGIVQFTERDSCQTPSTPSLRSLKFIIEDKDLVPPIHMVRSHLP